MATCFCCNKSVEWDAIKKGGSLPPNFSHRKISGQVYTLCTGCIGDMMPGTDYHIDDPEVPSDLRDKIKSKS